LHFEELQGGTQRIRDEVAAERRCGRLSLVGGLEGEPSLERASSFNPREHIEQVPALLKRTEHIAYVPAALVRDYGTARVEPAPLRRCSGIGKSSRQTNRGLGFTEGRVGS